MIPNEEDILVISIISSPIGWKAEKYGRENGSPDDSWPYEFFGNHLILINK